jgi:hypothetical protein
MKLMKLMKLMLVVLMLMMVLALLVLLVVAAAMVVVAVVAVVIRIYNRTSHSVRRSIHHQSRQLRRLGKRTPLFCTVLYERLCMPFAILHCHRIG